MIAQACAIRRVSGPAETFISATKVIAYGDVVDQRTIPKLARLSKDVRRQTVNTYRIEGFKHCHSSAVGSIPVRAAERLVEVTCQDQRRGRIVDAKSEPVIALAIELLSESRPAGDTRATGSGFVHVRQNEPVDDQIPKRTRHMGGH